MSLNITISRLKRPFPLIIVSAFFLLLYYWLTFTFQFNRSTNIGLDTGQILLFISFLLAYLSFLFCIKALYTEFKALNNKRIVNSLLFLLVIFIIRFIEYYFHFPIVLKQSFIFNQNPANLFYFDSTGDMIISSLIILFFLVNIYLEYFEVLVTKYSRIKQFVYSFISIGSLLILYFILFYIISNIVRGIGYNSIIGIDFWSINGLGVFITIVLLNITLFYSMLTFKAFYEMINAPFLFYLISILFFSCFMSVLVVGEFWLVIISSLLILAFIVIIKFELVNFTSIITYLVLLILFASSSSIIINTSLKANQDLHQLTTASLLTRENDLQFENDYYAVFNNIKDDTILRRLIFENTRDNEYIINKYFQNNYFEKLNTMFNIQLTICTENEMLTIEPEGIVTNCNDYFNQILISFGTKKNDSSLFLVRGESENIYYVGKYFYENQNDTTKGVSVFIEFFHTIIPEGLGYTKLLIDSIPGQIDLEGYSFSWYKNRELVYKFGNFPYNTNSELFENYPAKTFFNSMGYRNLKVQINPDHFFVISRPIKSATERMLTFSLLFIFFGIIMIVILTFSLNFQNVKLLLMNFRIRLQFFFIVTITMMILLLAFLTFYYFESSNSKRLKDELNEKTLSVIIELQHKLIGIVHLNEYDENNLQQMLRKFSLVFFSDINVYDPSGLLIASSRPEIFEKGLQKKIMNPKAFEELYSKNQLFFFTEEYIGSTAFYSSYAPLLLVDNQIAGYVNLPYFARQSDIERSYFLMISSFINLFVILGIIGTFLALFLSKILTKPLIVLQESLASIQIDKPNAKIEWSNNDEIGLLIKEYNKMIEKLEQSTLLLKQSERESAWREVARQIAHEIRNPLTPMKLNIQYLEKAYDENDPGFHQKMKRISASIINQIDTLDNVAEMFSDFAKQNAGNLEKVDLFKIASSCVSLFRNNTQTTIDIVSQDQKASYQTMAFEKDILRVFNNLIKNAIQSVEGIKDGKIEIIMKSTATNHIIIFSDNGKGIPDEVRKYIFQPYFTTKSGGTGLGLAIVKNIMSEFGGEISFESSSKLGTKFILKFLRSDRENQV